MENHAKALEDVQSAIGESTALATKGNDLLTRLVDSLSGLRKLGSDLKRFFGLAISGNLVIHRELVALRGLFTSQIPPQVSAQLFEFEDACGRWAPVPLAFITTWEAFEAVLEIRFRGHPGLAKIQKRQYLLQEQATKRVVKREMELSQAILPGQRINQTVLFRHFESAEAGKTPNPRTTCPACGEETDQPADVQVEW